MLLTWLQTAAWGPWCQVCSEATLVASVVCALQPLQAPNARVDGEEGSLPTAKVVCMLLLDSPSSISPDTNTMKCTSLMAPAISKNSTFRAKLSRPFVTTLRHGYAAASNTAKLSKAFLPHHS